MEERRRYLYYYYMHYTTLTPEELVHPEEYERPMWNHLRKCLEPLVEIYETEDEVIVRFDMPYVKSREDITLHATEDYLRVEAKMEKSVQFSRWGTFQRSVCFQNYYKEVPLPAPVDPSQAKAIFRKGVLEVRLPKKTRRFTIKVE